MADDADLMLQLWDYVAGWYEVELGLDNAALLVPLGEESSDFVAIDSARWDRGLPGFLWRQLSNPTFATCVRASLHNNRAGALPVLYRLA